MKLGLIVMSAIIGLFLGTGIALASYHTAPTQPTVAVPPVEQPYTIELPADNTITVPEVTIVGYVARKHVAPKPKTFVCGAPHLMTQGPIGKSVRDCEWR